MIVDETSNRKVVFVAIDILKSDLPLRIAFPVIIANTIQWFQSGSGIEDYHLQTGEILNKQIDTPSTIETVTITGPTGEPTEVAVEDGKLLFDQTTIAGFYELQIGEQEEVWAINLTDESESQIGATPSIEDLLDEEMIGLGGFALLRYPPWIYLVFLAVVLSGVEWWLYQRRRID